MIKVLVDLCLETEQLSVLYSASMGITTMTPTAEDRFDAKEEGRVIQIEQVRTFDALNRAKGILYGRSDDAPAWLTEAWEIMGMTHADLKEDSRVMASQRSSLMLLSTPATGERSFASITCTEKSLGTTGKSANAAGSR